MFNPVDNPSFIETAAVAESHEVLIMRNTGWPLRCMASRSYVAYDANQAAIIKPSAVSLESGITLKLDTTIFGTPVHDSLPLKIVPGPFTMNTLFYAACIMMGVFGLRLSTYIRRRHRKVCVWCGYDAWDLERCPECGNA